MKLIIVYNVLLLLLVAGEISSLSSGASGCNIDHCGLDTNRREHCIEIAYGGSLEVDLTGIVLVVSSVLQPSSGSCIESCLVKCDICYAKLHSSFSLTLRLSGILIHGFIFHQEVTSISLSIHIDHLSPLILKGLSIDWIAHNLKRRCIRLIFEVTFFDLAEFNCVLSTAFLRRLFTVCRISAIAVRALDARGSSESPALLGASFQWRARPLLSPCLRHFFSSGLLLF